MVIEFFAEPNPSKEVVKELEGWAPTNPFYTSSYMEAKRTLGFQPWILSLRENAKALSACTAFMKSGYLNRSLEITSLPPLPDGNVFWEGLVRFCRRTRVSQLDVHSYASASSRIPSLGGEIYRTARCEHLLDLRKERLWDQLSSNHKRSVKKAQQAGLQVRRVSDMQACQHHMRLVLASLERRRERGENITEGEIEMFMAFLQSGAGELFQACLDGKVLSSLLVLMSEGAGYYQTAGTSEEGMACGASPFLVYEIAMTLQKQGMQLFNMGGAIEGSPGLYRFKVGFGATQVHLESASFFLASTFKRKLSTAAQLLRNDPLQFLRHIGRLERSFVYVADPSAISPPTPMEAISFEKLSNETLEVLTSQRDELTPQLERLRQLQFNDAYGVFHGGKLAHISWFVTAEHDLTLPDRLMKLRSGEAEITHCITLPEYRGKDIYPFAIRSLCRLAAERGIRRIFMGTNIENTASQRGIEKAGLSRQGKILRFVIPCLPGQPKITYRGHRWSTKA